MDKVIYIEPKSRTDGGVSGYTRAWRSGKWIVLVMLLLAMMVLLPPLFNQG